MKKSKNLEKPHIIKEYLSNGKNTVRLLGEEINLLKFTPKFRDKSSSVTDRTTNLLLFELRYDKVK